MSLVKLSFQMTVYSLLCFVTLFLQFFTHPVVHSEMNRKWRGRFLMKKGLSKWTWFFLHVWCLFDMVLAPIAFYFMSYLAPMSDTPELSQIELQGYSPFAGKYFMHEYQTYFSLYMSQRLFRSAFA